MSEIYNFEIAQEIYKGDEINAKLKALYEEVPRGTCLGCASCCNESVPTFFSEFMNIFNYLKGDENKYIKYKEKALRHYFLELVHKQSCFFLEEDNKCAIYHVRPLTCRIFGHDDQETYEGDYELVLQSNLEARDYFEREYSITLPNEVVYKKIPYCKEFCSNTKLTIDKKNTLNNSMFSLDSKFLIDDIIHEDMINIGLSSWFALMYFEEEELDEIRITTSKEYLNNGTTEFLDEILKEI